jgi:CheY-like chemotaxis protein
MACTAKVTPPTTTLSACVKATPSCHGHAEATATNQDNHHSRGGGLHVLVAEDNTANQKLAKAMLKRLGHTVVIAENGAKAIEAVERAAAGGEAYAVAGAPGEEELEDAGPFHVVLMDVQMPVMDGLEATRELRRRGFTHSKLAIIGLTADYQPSERQKYLDVGMNDCLGKPTRMNELRSFLAKTMLQQELEAAVANISNEMVGPL